MRTNSSLGSDTGSSDSIGELIIEDEDTDEIVRPMNDIYTDQSPTSTPAIITNNNKAHNKVPQQPNPKTKSKLPGRVFAGQLKPTFFKSKTKSKPSLIENKPKSPRKSTLIPIKLKPPIIKSTFGASLSSNNLLVITPLHLRRRIRKLFLLNQCICIFLNQSFVPNLLCSHQLLVSIYIYWYILIYIYWYIYISANTNIPTHII